MGQTNLKMKCSKVRISSHILPRDKPINFFTKLNKSKVIMLSCEINKYINE